MARNTTLIRARGGDLFLFLRNLDGLRRLKRIVEARRKRFPGDPPTL